MSTVITTVVDRRYWDYVGLFTWCCNKSYPQYDVKILRKEEYFPEHPDDGYTTNALRFLTGYAPYRGYDHVYITDIDMMILPEKPSLQEFHVTEIHKYSRCYSNSLRNRHHVFECDGESWCGNECMSGLHFCTPEWFDRTMWSQAFYRQELIRKKVGRGYDGRMLYLMARDNGINLPGKHNLLKRHHGIHVGTFRLYNPSDPSINKLERKKNPVRRGLEEINKRISEEKKAIWRSYIRDRKYRDIVSRIKNNEVLNAVNSLERYVG